jgi:hypothetical protein
MLSTMGSGEDGQAPVAAARTPGEDLERIDDAERAGIQRATGWPVRLCPTSRLSAAGSEPNKASPGGHLGAIGARRRPAAQTFAPALAFLAGPLTVFLAGALTGFVPGALTAFLAGALTGGVSALASLSS